MGAWVGDGGFAGMMLLLDGEEPQGGVDLVYVGLADEFETTAAVGVESGGSDGGEIMRRGVPLAFHESEMEQGEEVNRLAI